MGLIAIIVIFFVIFVVTYVYFKCFRKTTDADQVKNKDLQAHYKSLSFSTNGQKSPVQPELQEQLNLECTYLTPVIECSYYSDTSQSVENDEILHELPLNRQRICNETTNSSYLTPGEVSPNVYIEIIQDNIERNVDQTDSKQTRYHIVYFLHAYYCFELCLALGTEGVRIERILGNKHKTSLYMYLTILLIIQQNMM